MKRRKFIAAFGATIPAATAGCLGLFGDEDEEEDDDEEDDGLDVDEVPPGFDSDGEFVDANELVDAHNSIVSDNPGVLHIHHDEGFSSQRDETIEFRENNIHRSLNHLRTGGHNQWDNGERLVEYYENDGTGRSFVPPTDERLTHLVDDPPIDAVVGDGEFETTSVSQESGDAVFVIEADELSTSSPDFTSVDIEQFEARARITTDGLVKYLYFEFSDEQTDEEFERTYEFEDVGEAAVEEPEWLAETDPVVVNTVAQTGYVQIDFESGDPVPAHSTVIYSTEDETVQHVLEDALEPGDTVYAYESEDELSLSVNEQPENSTAVPGEFAVDVGTIRGYYESIEDV